MRTRFTSGALALAALLLASEPAQAGEVRGVLLHADAVADRVRVAQPGGRKLSLPRGPDTAVTLNGEPFPFEQLQPGWRVAVRYNDRTGVATRIDAAHR